MSEPFDRQKLIEEKLRKTEEEACMGLSLIRRAVKEFLISEKGYDGEEIETDRPFEIVIDGRSESTSVDYIIKVKGKRFLAIKCSPGALESRERHLISFARVVEEYMIPFAMVTDGARARLLDTASGKPVSEGLDSIPDKLKATEKVESIEFKPCPAQRIEREKRILLAFDAISCTQESGE